MSLKLYPPGSRKGNQYFVARGSVAGRVREINTYTTDEKVAKRRAKELEAEIRHEQPKPERMTFEDAAKRYIAYRNPSREDRRRLEAIMPVVGPLGLRDIRPADIHEIANRLGPEMAPQSKNRQIVRPIVTVLHYAASAGLCDWIRVRAFKEARPAPRALDGDTASTLIDAAGPELRRLLVFLFYQGTRITKTLSLDWSQIDLKRRVVTLYNAKGDRHETFPLHEETINALGASGEGRVFPWRNRSSLDGALKKLYADTGIHFTPHMARHTLGTMMAMNRETTRAIMAALGHTTPVMSMRYQAADVEMVRGAINRVQLPRRA